MAYSTRAAKFSKRINSEYDLRADEEILLDEICEIMTLIDAEKVRLSAKKEPSRYEMENILRHRGLLGRLMRQLNLKDEGGNKVARVEKTSTNARKASMARWGNRG